MVEVEDVFVVLRVVVVGDELVDIFVLAIVFADVVLGIFLVVEVLGVGLVVVLICFMVVVRVVNFTVISGSFVE